MCSSDLGEKRDIINLHKQQFDISFLPLICYEIIYSGKLSKEKNYDLIINISEDGWFGESIGPHQHFSHSIFRSIEEGKSIIRSTNYGTLTPQIGPSGSAPGNFAQLASAYRAKHGVSAEDLKRAIAHVSVKSHANGAKNPKAHLQKEVTEEQVLNAPMIAEPLGLFDCCGVSDGAAAAIVTTPEIAKSLGKDNIISVKALQLAVSNGLENQHNSWDGSYFHTVRVAAKKAYAEANITKPREQVSMMEVHDCFSVTELVTMEDLFISEEGNAVKDVMDGFYDADGKVPCQIDGGLKCFGHPIGASGLRMLYEMYLQLQGRAGERQLSNPSIGLTHNLGGQPANNVCSIAIIGALDT